MVYILLLLVFVALLILVFAPEQKALVSVDVEVEQVRQVEPLVHLPKDRKDLLSVVVPVIPERLLPIFQDEEEDDLDLGNYVAPSESAMKKSKANYERLEKTSQYGGKKIKWSTIHGREFGTRRKFKMKRAQARQDKRLQKLSWSSYNELYEDELPYQIEKVVLVNKRDSFLAIK